MGDSLDNAHISAGDGPDTLPFIEPPKGQGLVDIVAALTPWQYEQEKSSRILIVSQVDGRKDITGYTLGFVEALRRQQLPP